MNTPAVYFSECASGYFQVVGIRITINGIYTNVTEIAILYRDTCPGCGVDSGAVKPGEIYVVKSDVIFAVHIYCHIHSGYIYINWCTGTVNRYFFGCGIVTPFILKSQSSYIILNEITPAGLNSVATIGEVDGITACRSDSVFIQYPAVLS